MTPPKHSLNDTVWFIAGNQLHQRQITRIEISLEVRPGSEPAQFVKYYMGSYEACGLHLFSSREELLGSL